MSTPASFSTFAGMHTNEDWSTTQARSHDGTEEEDEIVQELPIVLSQELASTLYLMQSPLRPPHRPYDAELGERVSLKVKPIQKKVEMQYKIEEAGVMYQHGAAVGAGMKSEHRGHNFDTEHEYSHVKTVTLQGKNVQPKTNYCAGVLSNGVLHLTPISAVCRFRPQLSYIDDAQAAALASSEASREAHRAERLMSGRMTEEEEMEMEEEQYQKAKEEESKKELQTVVMKVERKRGGAAGGAAAGGASAGPGVGPGGVMRKQTYAYIKQLEESEKWVPLRMHEQDSAPAVAQFSRLLSAEQAPLSIPFNVPAQHYLQYVNPPDLLDSTASESMIATGDPLFLSFDERLLHFMRNCRVVHMRELCTKMQIVSDAQLDHAVQLLASMCWVVQGCWVLKSAIVYDRNWRPGVPVPPPTLASAAFTSATSSSRSRAIADRVQLAREYMLTQFARSRTLFRDEVMQVLLIELEPLEELLDELAVCTTVSDHQKAAMGVAPRALWEWKLPSDPTLAQYFPKAVAQCEAQLVPLENELRSLLVSSTPHPSRDAATRGLTLTNTNEIVHAMAPAGLTANRTKPNQAFTQSAAAPASASAAAAAASASSAAAPAGSVSAWQSHLVSLFSTHGVLRASFVQQQLALQGGAAAPLQEALTALTTPFGPAAARYLMDSTAKANQQHRAAIAALFTSSESVTTAEIRAALPKSVSDDKRRDIMKEFAVYTASTQTWKLRPGQP